MNVDNLPDGFPVPDVSLWLRCSACGTSTRRGAPVVPLRWTLIAAAIARLPVNDATLDGEAACLSTEDGNFHALRSRHARQDARPIV
jgi:hypothetical protein